MTQFLIITLASLVIGQAQPSATPEASASAPSASPVAKSSDSSAKKDADAARGDNGASMEQVAERVATGDSQNAGLSRDGMIRLAGLIAAVMFIWGIKGLTHPRTAVRGNMIASMGMLLAVVATLYTAGLGFTWIIVGLIIGSVVGAWAAIRVEMTGMPQMVALFNGFGGVASSLVAGGALVYEAFTTQSAIATVASGLIGSLTLTGSLVAYAKLEGIKWIPDGQIVPGQKLVNLLLLIVSLALGWALVQSGGGGASPHFYYWLICIVAGILGILLTVPIGGADMPVVIALLNSYSGLAACATGFVINNNVLIIAGSLVGASGLILTKIMCKAMNRSLANVIFGTIGPSADTPDADDVYKTVKSAGADEIAMLFDSAQKAVVVPGYGMAVSQAQHSVRDLANLLESRGCHVDFAVHPVAGRMPGHMNVLLAEANIDYDRLKEMDEINPELEQYDVGLVIGANDVVNPVARTDPKSPIAGMPIIDIDKCRTVVVVKRSLSPGFAGIPNPLFAAENTLMYFGDGKKAMTDLITAIKES